MDEERIVMIEGRRVVVQIALCEGIAWADFVLADRLREYLEADRQGDSPWFDVVGWADMKSALTTVWKTVIELAQGSPIGIEASDDRRARVYTRILRRCGFNVETINRDVDDTVLIVRTV